MPQQAGLTAAGKVALMRELYETLYEMTDTFEEQTIGTDLAYLFGAILKDQVCSWKQNRPLVQLLSTKYPEDHPAWDYVVIDT